jgi:hypothetical protein
VGAGPLDRDPELGWELGDDDGFGFGFGELDWLGEGDGVGEGELLHRS